MTTPWELDPEEKRMNLEMRLLAVVTNFGGQHIVAGPAMHRMVAQLADTTEECARMGLLPARRQ